MLLIPKCTHCDKMLASIEGTVIDSESQLSRKDLFWLCPETKQITDPTWVKVQEAEGP